MPKNIPVQIIQKPFKSFKENTLIKLQEIINVSINSGITNAIEAIGKLDAVQKLIANSYKEFQLEIYGQIVMLTRDDKNLPTIKAILKSFKIDFTNFRDPYTGGTLLHEACLYGSTEIVKHLLKLGFNVNMKDNYCATPLHQAVIYNHFATVEALYNFNALNLPDEKGLYPIHVVSMNFGEENADKTLKALLQGGAKILTKLNIDGINYTYSTLVKAKSEGLISSSKKAELKKQKIPEDLEHYKGVTNFFMAFLSEENNAEYYSKAINLLHDTFNKLKKTYLNKTKKITNIHEDILSNEALIKGGNILFFMGILYCCFKDNRSEEIREFVIKNAEEFKLYSTLARFYNELSIEACEVELNTQNAHTYAKLAYDILQNYDCKKLDADTIHAIIFTYGSSLEENNPTFALEIFKKALKYKPHDDETIVEMIRCHYNLDDYREALKEITAISDKELQDLHNIFFHFLSEGVEEYQEILKKFNFSRFSKDNLLHPNTTNNSTKYSLYNDIYTEICIKEGKIEEAILNLKESLSHAPEGCLQSLFLKILRLYELNYDIQGGSDYLKFIHSEYPKFKTTDSIRFKYYESIFYDGSIKNYEQNLALKYIIDNAQNGYLNPYFASKALEFNLIEYVTKNLFDEAKSILNATKSLLKKVKLPGIEIKLKIFKGLLWHIINSKLKLNYQDNESDNKEEVDEELFADLDSWTPDKDLNKILSTFDGKAINNYFQSKRAQVLKAPIFINTKPNAPIWKTSLGTFRITDIYKIKNKHYAVISDKIKKDYPDKLEKFEFAIKHGIISKANYSVGIVEVPKQYFKLKINGDDRPYTTIKFKDAFGNFLIVFNKNSTHAEFKKIKLHLKLKIEDSFNFGLGENLNIDDLCKKEWGSAHFSSNLKEEEELYCFNDNHDNNERELIG